MGNKWFGEDFPSIFSRFGILFFLIGSFFSNTLLSGIKSWFLWWFKEFLCDHFSQIIGKSVWHFGINEWIIFCIEGTCCFSTTIPSIFLCSVTLLFRLRIVNHFWKSFDLLPLFKWLTLLDLSFIHYLNAFACVFPLISFWKRYRNLFPISWCI